MDIQRRGAARDEGVTSVKLAKIKFQWNDAAAVLVSSCDDSVRNFTGEARHRYRVRQALPEIAKQMKFLGDNATAIDDDQFVEAFAPVIAQLNRIIARASRVI